MKIKGFLLLTVVLAVLTNCKEDENTNPTNSSQTQTKTLNVSADLTNWIYFNFTSGTKVTINNFQDTLAWDLGIHYESFRTNGGKSGIGEGAVIDLGVVDFTSVTLSSINSSNYVVDDSISVLKSMVGAPVFEKVPGCVSMEAMFQSPQGPPPHTYAPNNHVYIIRTATGKNVKLIGTSFFNDLGDQGYFNFKYEFLD